MLFFFVDSVKSFDQCGSEYNLHGLVDTSVLCRHCGGSSILHHRPGFCLFTGRPSMCCIEEYSLYNAKLLF